MNNEINMDMNGFYTGKILDAYRFLGCHLTEEGAVFRTFAPEAVKISVIGEFNNWSEEPMHQIYDGNFWECEISGVKAGMKYKYRIYRKDNIFIDHADPYGFGMERPPMSASITRDIKCYQWSDNRWMEKRSNCKNKALNIYEVHLGSWRKKENNTWYSYKEIAEPLITYVKKKGFNYIELMPIAEHPCNHSWGYQQTGFYSPTARYGTLDELKYLIDYAHKNDVGMILDFVAVHFAVDGYSLAEYDGTALYEYPHIDVGLSEWGSKNFNHSRGEVRSFLQSCACYWLKEFHFDGIRFDALSNILYWQGNKDRGENKQAIEFIKYMNAALKEMDASVMLIAEDSTSYEGVTKPAQNGGLGFDYKWDIGWMNDTLAYFRTFPNDRKRDYHKLTFSMMYYKNENFLLPFSHDEVVHGKATILQKMHGEYEEKFPQARALYLYMYAHPGKKLNFMGNEIGQLREWDEKREQDWDILKYPIHDSFAGFMEDLCMVYQNNPALYERDYETEGFQWIDCHQEDKCIYVFERICRKQKILAIFNFSDKIHEYELKLDHADGLHLLLASDAEKYGGCQKYPADERITLKNGMVQMELNAFSGLLYEII